MPRIPKMNWDKIHKEDLIRRQGSEWVREEKPRSTKANRRQTRKSRPVGPVMKGCTCGKRAGFVGEHKMSCPLRAAATKVKSSAVPRSPIIVEHATSASGNLPSRARSMSLSEFASRIKKAGHQDIFRSLLDLELILLKRDSSVSPRQRDETSEAIENFLREL